MREPTPPAGRSDRRRRRAKPRPLGFWAGLGVVALTLAYAAVLIQSQPHVRGDRLIFTDFLELTKEQHILDARILDVDSYVVGTYDTGGTIGRYSTPYLKDGRERLVDILVAAGVPVTLDQQNGKRAASLASTLLPMAVLIILFLYLVLSFRRGTGLFGPSSGPRLVEPDSAHPVTFADVAGQRAAVAEIREIAEFLSDPQRFAELGAAVPKGILLFGPPGCGKTLLARALAGEAGAAFLSISGSDFVELYVGVGAARVRDLFKEAREAAPAIVFIDELDAVGRSRAAAGGMNGSPEQEQALNQILVQMDGFSPSQGIVVVAATNRPDVLDPALLRPGRFDRSIGLERPDVESRLEILELHARSKRMAGDVDLAAVAGRAIGLTGADLASVLNEAALLAARARRKAVGQPELDAALQRILEAPERQRRLSLRERSIARRFTSRDRVTFDDVAGVDEAVAELAEVRDYLVDPERFEALGARIPRGVLLSGPPGCGKTLLARAVAGEANAAFFTVAASEFAERFTGVGAARMREVFAEARAVAPAIVFIDEIDTVGAARRSTGGSEENEQTLNQLLAEMDGFEPHVGVLVMGATNRPDLLDPALLRPGRFDRHVRVDLPDRVGRLAILALYAQGRYLAADVSLETLAALTRGFSGADLANVLNEAALLAVRRSLDRIAMAQLDEAVDRTLMGVSSRAVAMSDEERRMVAYHEAGHALVARALPGSAQPHKLTIVGRGTTLGYCTVLEKHDRLVQTRSALLDTMAVALGGREAEVLVLGEPGSSSASDLRRVGETARRMVRELGMSDALGPFDYPRGEAVGSEEASQLVDREARRLAEEARARARSVLVGCRPELDRVVDALLLHETLSSSDLDEIMKAVTPLAGTGQS